MKKKSLFYLGIFLLPLISKSQVNYNFESGVITDWLQTPNGHWQASTAAPLTGSFSLKHTFNSTVDATDRISVELPSWNPNSGNVKWQFKIRHGYDPSASNRWWIFLMSDKDANNMSIGGGCSGYAVGVNVIGSDDLLKIWKFTNGTPQAILTSTLNWQTQIGKTVPGAIEVDRKSNGTFFLKASTTGSFLDLVSFGSAIDNSNSFFSYFGISYSYTSSADQLLWVDDIQFNFTPLNSNDLTSAVIGPSTQVSSETIQSSINSTDQAMDVLKFQIRDYSSTDVFETRVKKITIKKANSSNAANWINSIGGFKLISSSNEVLILNQAISENQIEFQVDSTTMIIPNGQSDEFTLSLYLKPDNLVDGSTLKFMIDSANHGFEAGISGSGFANTFIHKVYSNEFSLGVSASKLKFSNIPADITINKPFLLSVDAIDNGGNLDKDYIGEITLSLLKGSGLLSTQSGLTKQSLSGIATWNDLTYNDRGTIEIQAQNNEFEPVLTGEIQVVNDTTSVVTSFENQPIGGSISSLSCYPADAVEVLRFRINDQGTSDGVPTIVKSIKISREEIENTASLTKSISGVLVKVGGFPINASQPDIKTAYFTISFGDGNLIIPDGSFVDVNVWIYLKEDGITDNQKIQLKVDAKNHGFTAYSSGSSFSESFPAQIVSNVFSIDVKASKIKYATIPTRVGVNRNFSVVLSATDLNSNVDKDYSGVVNLSLLSGTGLLAFPNGSSSIFTVGSITYDSLTYNKPEYFSLVAVGNPLTGSISQIITCGDSDGGTQEVYSLPTSKVINSNSVTEETAAEVIRFKIFDGGTSDNLPLLPTKINLLCFDPTIATILNMQIAGFVVKVDGKQIPIDSYKLNNEVFEIIPSALAIIIPDNDTVTFSISVFLSKGVIVDNFSFQFYIPSVNHEWESISTGTEFSPVFKSTIYGPEVRLNVDASKLKFTRSPFSVGKSIAFPIEVSAIDSFGNVDYDFNDQVTLGLNFGSGIFSCSNKFQDLTEGFCSWNDVSLDKPGIYRLSVVGRNLGVSISEDIYCGIDKSCIVQESFENNINQSWVGSNDWLLSTINPINGMKSLQHKPKSVQGISVFSVPVSFPLMGDKIIEWNFTIRNGDWDPSSDSYFYNVIMCNSSTLASDEAKGFAVGINPSSGNDFITLWYFEEGKRIPLISSKYDWNPNDEVSIRVGLTPQDEWKLWSKSKESACFSYAGEKYFSSKNLFTWSGLAFRYSSTRSGQLWFDDLSICASDYPPIIVSAKPLNLNTVRINFSEKVNVDDAMNKFNYSIFDNDGNQVNVKESTAGLDSQNEFFLRTNKLPFGKLLLKSSNINDLNGNSVKDSISFGLGEFGSIGKLIINEIMANPIPAVGLSECEYIELYNPTVDTVFLEGWKIKFDSKTISLPSDTIMPNSYVVLCTTTAKQEMSVYGKAIGVTSFPALLNGGMMIKLFDSSNALISFVDYRDAWYRDDLKKDGGWSLEKIDYTNLAEGKQNWSESISLLGGTPCAINSVATTNPDVTSPRVLFLEVVSEKQILLQFSEPMDSLMLSYTSNYEVDQNLEEPINATIIGEDFSQVQLTFANEISSEIIYSLCINEEVTDFSGNKLINECLKFTFPQSPNANDIVINEILFNPFTGGVDFVEVYNRSSKSFNLNKLLISNRNIKTI